MLKHTAAEMGKSGQIWDTKPKTGQMGVPENCDIFQDTSLKSGLSRKIRHGWDHSQRGRQMKVEYVGKNCVLRPVAKSLAQTPYRREFVSIRPQDVGPNLSSSSHK